MTRACSHNECFSVGKSKASVRALQGDALVRFSTHALCLNRSPFGSSGLSREVVIELDPMSMSTMYVHMRRKFLSLVHKSSARESELGMRRWRWNWGCHPGPAHALGKKKKPDNFCMIFFSSFFRWSVGC